MTVETRDFGTLELEESQILTFVQPILGFEEYRRYALVTAPELGPYVACLQSLEEPGLCFVLMDPDALPVPYAPAVPDSVEEALGEGEAVCWVIAVLGEDLAHSTVNLKSPVLVNGATGRGVQLILEQDLPVRCPILGETGAETC